MQKFAYQYLLYNCLALIDISAQCTESTSRLHHRVQQDERIPKLVVDFFFEIFHVFFSLNFRNFCSDFPWAGSGKSDFQKSEGSISM
eukprot:SAG11_NODE_115_length_16019_cov_12.462940_7_plen_87_part_00